MTTTIGNQITLDGQFSDWLAQYMLANAANTVAGYLVYGALLTDATLGPTYVIGIDATGSTDPTIGAGTVIYLNTDQNSATGFSPFGHVGAEFEVQFALDSSSVLQPYLYAVTSAGATTLLNNGAPLAYGASSNGESLELAVPQSLLTPSGGAAPTSINFSALVNNGVVALPGDFTNAPEYVIKDTAIAPTMIAGTITLDGAFSDWPAAENIVTSGNTVAGYQVYGALLNDATLGKTYVVGIDATNAADAVIGAGTTIYLDTDQNTATGFSPFGAVGAEYEVVFNYGANSELDPFLYSLSSTGVATEINGDAPLPFGVSANGEGVELAIPQTLLTPVGGAAPTSISVAALINNSVALPGDFAADPQYNIVDPATLVAVNHAVKKVAIIYSATTAALFDGGGPAGESAYSDLFLAAQQQARAAGVSYDLLSESDLTNVVKLSQYSALIFPDFQNVQSSQASAIANALYQVVYDYKVPIITAGDFMTDDQSGNPLPGNSYADMQSLLNLTSAGYGTASYSVTPDPAALSGNNPILAGYTSGELIGGASGEFAGTTAGYYTSTGYLTFAGYTQPATTIADINIQGGAALAGVVQTTTGGTNTDFATPGLFGDSNLLQHVIQNTVFGTTPSLSLDITRFKGIVNSRTDMDQSQFPTDVDPTLYDDQPAGTQGIYDEMIPILQTLKSAYDFVGSYYINVGDDANTANDNFTNWSVSLPYYQDLLEMGDEIGTHSYTHLIAPPTPAISETTKTATAAGATQIVVSQLPSYNGATLGMVVTDANNDFGPGTIITAYSGDATSGYTLTLSYLPGGYGTPDAGAVNAIPAGSTIAFGVPTENTNFLSTSGAGPFTYNYEFNQGTAIEDSNVGITIAGAAVPGANDYLDDSLNILSAFPSQNGLTGYVSGGWTGVGSGSPNAIGYITPSATSSVYIAPNVTFDFSEIQYENKSVASSLADWESLFGQLSANSATPIIVWPWHDYGITDWPTDGVGTTPPGFTEALYQDFIAYAHNAGDEFVTSEDLAQRVAAEQAATLSETTSGNVITATVTPSATEPDLGAMALNVVNGAAGQVIQNAGAWYAYNTTSVFLADDAAKNAAPETFIVTLGATQNEVTHVDLLPMRADLQSVSGDGTNLTFSFTGDGTLDVHIKTPAPGVSVVSIVQSIVGTEGAGALAPTATLTGDDLQLTFNDGADAISTTSPQGVPVQHTVTISEGAAAAAGASFVFEAPVVAIASAGGFTNQTSQTITGTVSEPSASQVVGTMVTLYDNGSTTALGIATVQAGVNGGLPTWTATVTLTGDGTHSIVGSDTDVSGLKGSSTPPVVYTLDTVAPTVTASESVSGPTKINSDTISATAVAETAGGDTIASVNIYNGTTLVGAASLSSGTTANGGWSFTASGLADGTYNFSAVAKDAAGNATPAALAPVTVDTATPKVAIAGAGGVVTSSNQTIAGTVTEPTEANVVGTTVSLYDNGALTAFATATVQADGSWSAPVTLSSGVNSVVAQDVDLAGNAGSSTAVVYTNGTVTTPTITSEIYSGGHWILGGTATTGATVTVYDGAKSLGTATASTTGTWTFITAENNSAIRVYTAIATSGSLTSVASAPVYEGTTGANTLAFASEVAVATAALINGNGGTDTLQLTAPGVLIDTDFAHVMAIQTLALTGASGVTLGTNASAAGVKTIVAGAGSTSVTDNNTGTLTVNAAALASGSVLTLSGSGAITVTGLQSALNAAGYAGTLSITANGPAAQSIVTGSGSLSIADNAGGVTVDAGALAAASTLTLTGAAATTVTNLTAAVADTGAGNLTVTTGAGSASVKTGSGSNIVNAAAMTGSATLTLTGGSAATVTIGGALNASADTGALIVTATGSVAQSITAGTGAMAISDSAAGGSLTVDAAASGSGRTLTLSGSNAVSVVNLGESVSATGLSGALAVTTKTNALSIATGKGMTTVNAAAATGALTLTGAGAVVVTALGGNLTATAETGALTVTTTGATQTMTTGAASIYVTNNSTTALTINAAALIASDTLTLSGTGKTTVSNLKGNLVATGGTGALAVTATNTGAQGVTTGTGSLSIADNANGGSVSVNAAALGASSTLTLTGSAAKTVSSFSGMLTDSGAGALAVTTGAQSASVKTGSGANTINASAMTAGQMLTLTGSSAATVTAGGGVNASAYTGALSILETGAGTIQTGSGTDAVTAKAGGNTIDVSGKGDSFIVTGHTLADTFAYSATSASLNTAAGHNTIIGFAAAGSINDLLNLSVINPNLTLESSPLASGSKVAADSIALLYSGGSAMIYVNDTTAALSTASSSLMEITLNGVSSGLSVANFKA